MRKAGPSAATPLCALVIRSRQRLGDACYWPLYEVDNDQWKLNYKPREKKPVVEWLKRQGRFRHLFQPQFRHVIDEIQAKVDEEWERLLERCGE